MIQRIQTVHYLIAIVLLAIPLLGFDLFSFSNSEATQHVTFFGNELTEDGSEFSGYQLPNLPFYWLNLAGILLLFITMLSFKKLKAQFRIGRFTVIFLFISLIILCVALYAYAQYLSVIQPNVMPGAGFYLFAASIIFVLFGNSGVKKDRKLLDSLNRLR